MPLQLCRLLAFSVLGFLALMPFAPVLRAQTTVTWTGSTDGDWATATNWTTDTVPNATTAIARFGTSSVTTVSIPTSVTKIDLDTLRFLSGADSFTIGVVRDLNLWGTGIVNSSSSLQTLENSSDVNFYNAASAGAITYANYGDLTFYGTSTAATATINNHTSGSNTDFRNTATAGSATIANHGSAFFWDSATAGSSTVTNDLNLIFFDSSTAGSATITNNYFAYFYDTASAGSANFTNNYQLTFEISATAGSATITNGSEGEIFFKTGASAGSASLANEGRIVFQNASTAGAASITNSGSASSIDISGHLGTVSGYTFSIGALAGGGTLSLGGVTTYIGGLDTTTTFSGLIEDGGNYADGGAFALAGGAIIKQGTGTLTLTHANTYTGATTINAGTLAIDGESRLGANPINNDPAHLTLNGGTLEATATFALNDSSRGVTLTGNGGTFKVDTGFAFTIANAIASTGAGALTKSGNGTLILSAANTYTGDTNITNGTLQLGASGVIPNTSAIMISSGGTFDLDGHSDTVGSIASATIDAGSVTLGSGTLTTGSNDSTTTFSGVISGSGSLTKSGSGMLTLSGANTYSGITTVTNGTLQLGASHVISNASAVSVSFGATFDLNGKTETVAAISGAGAITLGSGALTAGSNDSDTTFSGVISGTGGTLTKTGSGTLTLSGTNTYTGTTTINDGFVSVSADVNLGNAGAISFGGGVLKLNASFDSARAVSLVGDGTFNTVGTGVASTWSGIFSGSGNLIKAGSGTLTLTHASTFTGTTTINTGTLAIDGETRLGANPALFNAGQLTIASATLQATVNVTIDDTNRGVTLAGSGGTFNVNSGATLTIASPITGTALTKSGPGTLMLSGANDYSGRTRIEDGTLQLAAANRLASTGAMTLAGGAFATGGFSQTLGALTLGSNSTINFGSGTSALAFAQSSGISWSGTLTISNYTSSTDTLRFGSNSSGLTSSQLSAINFGGGLSATIDSLGYVTGVSAIPEPSTYTSIAGLGALGVGLWRRRRRGRNPAAKSTGGRVREEIPVACQQSRVEGEAVRQVDPFAFAGLDVQANDFGGEVVADGRPFV